MIQNMRYHHVEKPSVYVLNLFGLVVICGLGVFVALPDQAVHTDPRVRVAALIVIAGVIMLSATRILFGRNIIDGEDDGLIITPMCGPVPLPRRQIPYIGMTGVEVKPSGLLAGKTPRWYGGGFVHIAGRGWAFRTVYNCVVIHKGADREWIITDDAEGLLTFLKAKIPPAGRFAS